MEIQSELTGQQRNITASKWIGLNWLKILFFTAFILGLVFRISGLGNKIYSHDEALLSLYASGYTDGEVLTSIWNGTTLTPNEVKMFLRPGANKNILDVLSNNAQYNPLEAPLFLLLAHLWMNLIGYTSTAMRSLAMLFGLLCIPAMYWLGLELFQSTRTAKLAAVLITVSPFHILFSQDARPYSLVALLILLSSAALIRAMRVDRWANWLVYAATLALGMYTQQLFALVAVVHVVYFVSIRTVQWKINYAGFITASLLALLAYSPWLYQLTVHWQEAMLRMTWASIRFPLKDSIQRWLLIFTSPFIDMDFVSGNLVPYILRAFVLLLLGLALLYMVFRSPRREWSFVLLLCIIPSAALILPDIVLGGSRSLNGRYLVPSNTAAILFMAYFLAKKLKRGSSPSQTWWGISAGCLLLLAIASNANSLMADTWWNKEHSRVTPELVRRLNQSDQGLLIVSGHHATNIGDVLVLSLNLDPDVRLRLYREKDLDQIDFSSTGGTVFWMPGTRAQAEEISRIRQVEINEEIYQILWSAR